MSDPKRRANDSGLLHWFNAYQAPVIAVCTVIVFVCGVAVSGEKVVQNASKVPQIQEDAARMNEAILRLTALQEEGARERSEMKNRLKTVEDKLDGVKEINDKIDILIERSR